MLDERTITISNESDTTDLRTLAFNHPQDVLHDRTLSVDRKRAILATWASDAHAVPNVPALRQLPSGAIVTVDTVLAALTALDASEPARRPKTPPRSSWARPRLPIRIDWRRGRRRDDDDDDPPPCPAAARPPGLQRDLHRHWDLPCRLAAA